MVTDSTPSSVAAGGGVFIAHVGGLNRTGNEYGLLGFELAALRAAMEDGKKRGTNGLKTKNPAGFAGEKGSRKIDDLESDLELPASLLG